MLHSLVVGISLTVVSFNPISVLEANNSKSQKVVAPETQQTPSQEAAERAIEQKRGFACKVDIFLVPIGRFVGVDKQGFAVFVNDKQEVYTCPVKRFEVKSDRRGTHGCLDLVRAGKDLWRCLEVEACAQNLATLREPAHCR